MSGWFSSTKAPPIDRSSRRWTVAVHEAAHVVVALALGWTVEWAVINGDRGGSKTKFRGRIAVDTYHLQNAIISLAGPRASARQRWLMPYGCGRDDKDARAFLRGTGMSYGTAKREAERLVNANWPEILRVAERLYRDGAL